MAARQARPGPWWYDTGALERVVADLVADELARLRPGGRAPRPPPGGWPEDFALDGDGLGADSLELLGLSTRLAQMLHLHVAGVEDHLLARRTLGDWIDTCRTALEHCDAEVTFRTSGSTGSAKTCTHRLEALEQEAAFLATLLSGARRVLTVVPAHHIYGFLFTILLPRHLGAPVIDLRASSPAALAALARPGDLVVAHPDYWRAVAALDVRLPPGVTGVTSTAPCPPEVAREVHRRGLARLVEVYGSSETAGVGWRDDAGADYTLFPYWRCAGDHILARTLPSGVDVAAELQDHLSWSGPGRFRPCGRRDTVVQVGGVNVSLDHVRRMLKGHRWVADAAVRRMRPEEGQRLKAFIVPTPDAPPPAELRQELEAWIERTLPAAERPRALTFGAALPVNALGKLADWPIGAPAQDPAP